MPGIDFGLDRFGRRDPDPLMTVTQLTAAVKSAITSMPELSHVAVAGEISSCTRSAKGHIYITLKDGASVVSAVVFAGSARTLTHQPQVNEQVVCYGSVDVYGGQGRYQLYCTDITLQGAGTQAAELEALRRRLEQEGLFSQHRPIPAMPRIIAVVTSAGGAALTDIKNVLARRCPMVKLLLIPALVQAVEDLSCFNSEVIARAVYASRIPTISAVGHERDYSICDYAADLRAPTPSAAAELAASVTADMMIDDLSGALSQISSRMSHYIAERGSMLDSRMALITALSPASRLRTASQRLDSIEQQIRQSIHSRLDRLDRAVMASAGVISALNPLAVLSRGYSVTSSGERIVTEAGQLSPGDDISIRLGKGSVTARVTSVSED